MERAKILVVDDESRMRKLVKDFLTREGYTVLEARDGMEAMDLFYEDKEIALIILDVMMPKMDGWQVCREVRETSKVPIIMLTARSEERDELQGFELGVDEYISKPFSPKILVARVNAILRRTFGTVGNDSLEAGGITVDKSAHIVKIDGTPVELSYKEFELLTYFIENQGIALSREKILNNVWNYDYFGDARTIDTHVKKLRSKLGDKGEYIKTIWGMGYKFEVLSGQMTAIFIGLLVFILMTVFIVNTGFLGRYYMSHKQKDLIEMYEAMSEAVNNGNLGNEAVQKKLVAELEKTNIDVCAMDISDDGKVVFTNVKEEGFLYKQMLRIFFLKDDDQERILKHTNDYVVRKIKDPQSGIDYLEMWGYLSDNVFVTMRSPLDSIRESANLANQFLIYLGIFGLFFGGILVWIFSRKITKPVLELARLSEDMANLNFDAKYTSGGKNEIGVLGENFNKMSEQLEKTISELKTANNQLQHDIEQKEKLEDMRNEFLGNVSHELKTPIALIQGYAEGLKEGINDDPESTEFYCNVIIDEAGKMNRMVKNLLILNQLEFGSDEVEFERFDIVKLVKGVIASCDILIQQAEANIDFIAGESAYVWADEFKTEQVVRNYLTNAIHHAENEKRIEVKIIRTEGKVRVSVFNSGKPIPEEDIPKLWDKFYKVDKAHTREYGGNGIGLSIVKAIMESFHQGYGVKNYDNGVEFWFELDAKCGKV